MRLGRGTGVILLVCLLVSGTLAVPVRAATTYTDPQQRFSFTVPDGYTPTTAQLTPPVVAGFVAANPAGANFTVQVRDATGTLDAATAEFQKRYASGADSQPGPNGITALTLGGQPAEQFDYFTNAQGTRFHIAQIVTINGKALYILTLNAQEGDYDILISQTAALLTSFTFLSAGAAPTGTQESDGTTVYSDPQGRFSFTIPKDFQRNQDADLAKYAAAFDGKAANGLVRAALIVDTTDAPTNTTPSILTIAAAVRQNLNDKKYKIIGEQDTTLGGHPAYRFDATGTMDDGYAARITQVVSANGPSLYQVLFLTDQAHYDIFATRLQSMLSSFSFSAAPSAASPPASPATPSIPPPPGPPPASPPPATPPPTDNGR